MKANHSTSFPTPLTFVFLKGEHRVLKNFKDILYEEKIKPSKLGIKKGYQSHNLYITNDIQWVLLLKLLCLCITLHLLLYNRLVLLLHVNLLELKPSNSSLNLSDKNTT